MLRGTVIAVAIAAAAMSSGAQVTPTPPPPPASEPAPPLIAAPAPTPDVWFDVVPPEAPMALDIGPLDFDLDGPMIAPMPPMARFEGLHALDMELRNPPNIYFNSDIDFDFDFDRDMNFDFDRLDIELDQMDWPDDVMTPLTPLPPSSPIPPMAIDIRPMLPQMAMEPITMVPVAAMAPAALEAVVAATPRTPRAARAATIAAIDHARTIESVAGISPFERQFGGIASTPPTGWAQSDPADSLYKLARETLNRGEYRRAADLFSSISQRFPNSAYASDARYWRAFALYRIGGQAELRDALSALQGDGRYYQASLQRDAAVLATRIRGALAAQGDRQSAEMVTRAASQPTEACDREDLAVRVEALNSLGQTDPESTTPILRRLLARRDECSATLRKAALYLLARRTDPDAVNLVINTARNDADRRVRGEALRFLAAMPGDQALGTIEELARTPGDDELQRVAVAALARSDNPRAKQSLHTIIERADISEALRATALASIEADKTTDNGAYLRSVYPRLSTPRLKASAIRSVARIGGNENDQWLLSIVRNANEPVDVRAMALRYAGRSTIPIGDLVRMYDAAADRPLREQLVALYSQRQEPEATDKLLEIARKGTDPDMRRMAISSLSRKNDPRTKQLLLEIIDK